MPTYDMICQDCGHRFSVFCSISQKDNQNCPKCDSPKINQLFTSVNIGGGKSNISSSKSATQSSGFG